MSSVHTIDGSILEGGGQILRISTALAAITGTPLKFVKVRANREKGGFRPQHATGFGLVSDLCGSSSKKPAVGETTAEITPTRRFEGGTHRATTGTAGSCALLVQVSLPVCLFGSKPSQLICGGGTNADMAPQVDFLEEVFSPVMSRMLPEGSSFRITTARRGFFPQGGGEIVLDTVPIRGKLRAIDLTERGTLSEIRGYAYTAGIGKDVASRMANAVSQHLKRLYKDELKHVNVDISHREYSKDQAIGSGGGIVLMATFSSGVILGSTTLIERGVKSEDIAERCVRTLLSDIDSGACTDEYLTDQLVIFMALAEGTSRIRTGPEISLHSQTALHFVQEILGKDRVKVEIAPQSDGTNIISVTGIGFSSDDPSL